VAIPSFTEVVIHTSTRARKNRDMQLFIARAVFAGGLAGLGILSLFSADFALNWQPVPAWVPWREYLAQLSGLVLLIAGAGTFFRRSAVVCALILTIDVAIWLALLQLPRVAMNPTVEAIWLGFSENLVMVAGGWLVLTSVAHPGYRAFGRLPVDDSAVRTARFLFAAALLPIGLSHFVYVRETAAMVPAWLPARLSIAYLTGAAHVAAGMAMLAGVVPRLAAVLEASMISGFTLLVWLPRVAAAPASRFAWTALLASATLTGAAWAVAGSFPAHD
jgi:uncharacterized membrane protein